MRAAGRALETDAPWIFHLTGGRLCLDFANTVSWRRSARPIERLDRYGELVRFGVQAGLVGAAEARRLLREAARRPGTAERVVRDARDLRELIYGIFAGLAGGRRPAAPALDRLNAGLTAALARLAVAPTAEGFTFEWRTPSRALDPMLPAVLRSSAELLTSGDALRHLRTCGGRGCGWVFLDTTRNRSRRWCTMRVCGNRSKVRRHYDRRKKTAERTGPRGRRRSG